MSLKKLAATILILPILILPGCGKDQSKNSAPDKPSPPKAPAVISKTGCEPCHPLSLRGKHASLTCPSCHDGNDQTNERKAAHFKLTTDPAHPASMGRKCGNCHTQTATVGKTSHFTLNNEINLVRRHFGAGQDLSDLHEIPIVNNPVTPLQLVDDLLRRRCLRCHVYYKGDEYSQVQHGTGCGACHLKYKNGKLVSHEFIRQPTDDLCLSCHYGNRVGSDYYGRFAHDFKHEYRTPYLPDGSYPPRPYGVEQHRLSPDIHQLAGMTCTDCHVSMHEGIKMRTISCEACHLRQTNQPPPAPHLKLAEGQLILTTRQKGLSLKVPPAHRPFHDNYREQASCTVCHAQWTYNDQESNLLRIDHAEYEEWDELFVQDSAEVEVILLNSIYGDEVMSPVMTDKINGQTRPGLWLKGFRTRRWEVPLVTADQEGKLQTVRPVLDLHLSWVNEENETVFDNISGKKAPNRPYTPHTIGKAGAFYRQRLSREQP